MLLLQLVGGAEDAAEIADVLSENDDLWVCRERDIHRGVDRLDHVHGGHGQ